MSFKLEAVDFRIQLSAIDGGEILTVAESSFSGETWTVTTPRALFFEEQLTHLVRQFGRGRLRDSERRALGAMLFERLLPPAVQPLFNEARQVASGSRLRLYVQTDVPQVAALPWEFAYDRSRRLFLALDAGISLIRRWPQPDQAYRAAPQTLKILAVFSTPSDQPPIHVREEQAALHETLAGQIERGQVELHVLEAPVTLQKLQEALAPGAYNVLHFVGHGRSTPDGTHLALGNETNWTVWTDVEQLRVLLSGHNLRLLVLSAAESAAISADGPPAEAADGRLFKSLAAGLVADGLPAVVGLQSEIRDRAAAALNIALFQGLADRLPLDAALQHARQRVYQEQGRDGHEWAVPVLYTAGNLHEDLLRFADAPRTRTYSSSAQQVISSVGGTIGGDYYGLDSEILNVRQKMSHLRGADLPSADDGAETADAESRGAESGGVETGGVETGGGDLFHGAAGDNAQPQTAVEKAPEKTAAEPQPSTVPADIEEKLAQLRNAVVHDPALKPLQKVRAIALVEELGITLVGSALNREQTLRLLHDAGQVNAQTMAVAVELGRQFGLGLDPGG